MIIGSNRKRTKTVKLNQIQESIEEMVVKLEEENRKLII